MGLHSIKNSAATQSNKRVKTENIFIVIVLFALAAAFAGIFLLSQPMTPVKSVEINDTTGKINQTLLKNELKDLKTYKDTNVFVYVKNGTAEDDINYDTLKYAFDNRPEFIKDNKWANGYLILTLNIQSGDAAFGSGQIGTYYGEDLKISYDKQHKAQSQGYDSFHKTEWTEGLIKVAEYSTSKMAKPLWTSLLVQIPAAIIILLFVIVWFVEIKKSRKVQNSIDQLMDETTSMINNQVQKSIRDLHGSYFDKINKNAVETLEQWNNAQKDYNSVNEIPWFLVGFKSKEINNLQYRLQNIQKTSQMLETALILYHRVSGWEGKWAENIRDTKTALYSIKSDKFEDFYVSDHDKIDIQQLIKDLSKAESDMHKKSVDVNEVFQKVDNINNQISVITKRYVDYSLGNMGNSQAGYVKRAVNTQVNNYNGSNSNSLFFYYALATIYTPHMYDTGYSHGISSYNAHIQQMNSSSSSSSSSFSTSYGSSSGGFSGSGSSSSF